MKTATLIVQSAPENRPAWISYCLRRTAAWAKARGYEYVFLGDELFDGVPARFGDRPHWTFEKVTLSDYGRLAVIADYLERRPNTRVVWLDADIFIIDLIQFSFDAMSLPMFATQEVCHDLRWLGQNHYHAKMNNSVIGFTDLRMCKAMMSALSYTLATAPICRLMGGPLFLGESYPYVPLVRSVACPGPIAQRQLLGSNREAAAYCREIRWWQGWPIFAANLCAGGCNNADMMLVIGALMGHADILGSSTNAPLTLTPPRIPVTLAHRLGSFLRSHLSHHINRIYSTHHEHPILRPIEHSVH